MSRYSAAQLKEYAVTRPEGFEIVRQSLYDTLEYNAAGQSQLLFFQNPAGQAGKTLEDTNMESQGSLPDPKHFLVQSIALEFLPGVNPVTVDTDAEVSPSNFANDMYAFAKSGYLDLFISSKSYLTEAPLGKFPPKTHLDGDFSAGAASDQTNTVLMDLAQMRGRPYFIDPEVALAPNMNFNVSLNWKTPAALPSGQAGKVICRLDGLMFRAIQ